MMKRVNEESMNNNVTAQKNDSNEALAMHECSFCGKSFKNGKALGGHRRSHFQAAKVKSLVSNNNNNDNDKKKGVFYDDGSCNNGEKHTCYLCKKGFPSSHSLFGHMRTHPERPWRGVCPPPIHSHHHNNEHSPSNFEKDRDDYDDDDEYDEVVVAPDIDTSKSSLPRWQKKGKRGRKSTSAYEAAENLVFMSLRDNNNFLAFMSMMVEPKSHQSSIILCNRKNIDEASTSQKHVAKKTKFYAMQDHVVSYDSEEGIEKDYGSMNVEDALQDHVVNFDERKKKVKKLLVKKLIKGPNSSEFDDKKSLGICNETTQKKVNGYVCDICWKSFPTFQGLGGHRSIHNKEKSNNVMNMGESKSSDYAIAEDAFLRGLVIDATNEVQTEENTSPSQLLGPKILDFDLNMLPHDDTYESEKC